MAWEAVAVAVGVIAVTAVLARLVDRRMAHRDLAPEAVTRYRVLRRSIVATIVAVGVLSALMTVPQVRAAAGTILGSAAVLGLIVGLAAQTTLSNFVAGLLIAFTQPLRFGDRVEVSGSTGTVEEIGLTYTFIRLDDGSRIVIPNSKLASDTIRNSTIVSREKVAEITLQVPLDRELGPIIDALQTETAGERDAEVFVSALDGSATVTVRARADDAGHAQRLERELRLRAHARLREQGLFA
ncbi:MAG TPA: mechanosensitive ion channel domain-containing protein [Gaiellaceae bacterium]|nr:mechanosensitive ion channel domain-containing protein [Gaiellaceae bacterium]